MARKVQQKKQIDTSLTKQNYYLFGVAVVVLLLGYYFLSQGPADSFMSVTLAPIVLVIGYCVLVPLAVLWRRKA